MQEKYTLFSIFLFFVKKIPYNLFTFVFTALFAQFFLILSFFLPLKVIILLNMEKLPEYLTLFFTGYDKNEIILWLTFSIFIFYAISVIVERYSEYLILDSMEKILDQENVEIVPSNKLIYKFIHSYFKLISTFFLLLFMYILFLFLFPAAALFLLLCIIVIVTIFIYFIKHNVNSYNTYFKMASGIGFMMVFIYEVIDILYLKTQETSLLIILLSAVLARYIFMRGHYMINQLVFVHTNIENFHVRIKKCKT